MRQNIAGTLRGAYANTLVTDTEDCLRVRHDEQLDIATLCLFKEVFFHGVLVSKGGIQALDPAEEMRVVRYSIPLYTTVREVHICANWLQGLACVGV